jgi:hypothetical protein
MIDLKNLISITPLDQETKNNFLVALETASEGKKFEIKNFCWQAIFAHYQLKKQQRMQEILREVEEGKRQYSKADFENVDKEVFEEMNTKINALDNQADIAEIQQKLQEQLQKPTNS